MKFVVDLIIPTLLALVGTTTSSIPPGATPELRPNFLLRQQPLLQLVSELSELSEVRELYVNCNEQTDVGAWGGAATQ